MGLHIAVVNGPTRRTRAALWLAARDLGVRITTIGIGIRSLDPDEPRAFETVPIRPKGPLIRRANVWWWYPDLADAIERVGPDLVHVLGEAWGFPVLQSVRTGSRVVAHGADNRFRHGGPFEWQARRAVLRWVLPRLAGYACSNFDGLSLARNHGLGADTPTVVAPPGAPDPQRFRPPAEEERTAARRRFGLPPEGPILGYGGRLVPEKGLSDLLRTLRELGGDAPFAALWGHGPLEPMVRSALGSSVRGSFLGFLPYRDVPSALAACDLFVLPSRLSRFGAEQFGRAAVEALFCELPVVAYASGSLPGVLSGAARLVPEGDVGGLAEAIGELTDDPELRRSSGASGRQVVAERHHPARVAGRLVSFWDRVMGR